MKPITCNYSSPNVTGVMPQVPSSPSAASTAEAPPPLLQSADYSGGADPISLIAKMFTKTTQQQQTEDSLTADAEDKLEDVADARRISDMQKKAEDTFESGMAGGIGTIAKGGLSMLSAGTGIKSLEGAADVADGAGKTTGALDKKSADLDDVAATKEESTAKVAKRASDALRKQSDAASQSAQKVLDLLQGIKQEQDQCGHAALLKM